MNDSDIATLSARLAQIQRLRDSVLPAFALLKNHLESDMSRLTASLIAVDDDVTRGRIHQIMDFLRLPQQLDAEAQELNRILSQPDETTIQNGLDGLTGLFRMQ